MDFFRTQDDWMYSRNMFVEFPLEAIAGVKDLLKTHNISAVAKICGVSHIAIRSIIDGKSLHDHKTILAIMDGLYRHTKSFP